MPVEILNALLQLGMGGVFIWYLQRLVDRQTEQLKSRDELIATLYERIEDARLKERDRLIPHIERLRQERDAEREKRFSEFIWGKETYERVADALEALAAGRGGERTEMDRLDDRGMGSG